MTFCVGMKMLLKCVLLNCYCGFMYIVYLSGAGEGRAWRW